MDQLLNAVTWLGQHKLFTTLLALGIVAAVGYRREIFQKLKGGGSGDGIRDPKG